MNSESRTIAIGDIHGCLRALNTLLARLDLKPDDVVVMLGDAIDRGPDSRGVIERLMRLAGECQLVPILGNHEQMMLDAIDGQMPEGDWLIHGGTETLQSYAAEGSLDSVPAEHVEFIRSWGDYYETPGFFFAHGNYEPSLPLADQPWSWMRWESLKAKMPKTHCSGKTAIVGHTSNKQGKVFNAGHLVCIDTYCHGGYWLTALEPEAGRLWQANEQGEARELELPPQSK